jgi:hypothetical protein
LIDLFGLSAATKTFIITSYLPQVSSVYLPPTIGF